MDQRDPREESRGHLPAVQPKSAADIEAARRERLALVQRLTHGDEGVGGLGEQVKPAEKKKKRTRGEGGMEEEEEVDDDDEEMRRVMGFSGFDTTRGKHVDGNDAGAVSKHKARKYRQYMNRKGGFNRPLDKID